MTNQPNYCGPSNDPTANIDVGTCVAAKIEPWLLIALWNGKVLFGSFPSKNAARNHRGGGHYSPQRFSLDDGIWWSDTGGWLIGRPSDLLRTGVLTAAELTQFAAVSP